MDMHPSIWWLVTGVALVVIEMAAGTLFLLWFGVGAFLTAALAFFVPTPWVQYMFFAVSSVLLVALTRRWAHRLTGSSPRQANMDGLVGQKGKVTELIDGPNGRATIKVAGEVWRAETSEGASLQYGQSVTVKATKGNTLIVK